MSSIRLIFLIMLSVLLIMNCDTDESVSPVDTTGGTTGTLKILLTDAPGEFDAVNITFSEVSVHFVGETAEDEETDGEDGDGEEKPPAEKAGAEWIIVTDEKKIFNLLDLTDGVTALLGENELETGHYTQIRLVITEAEVVVDGTPYSLTIPSGTFKFVSGFDIVAEEPTELIVDFDAARSIHITGKDEYKIKPTIRIINNAKCGSIIGQVTNFENLPIAYAIAGIDTVNASYVNENNGKFTLGFLPAGTYTVSITDTLDKEYTNPDVSVTIGTKTDLGDITLE